MDNSGILERGELERFLRDNPDLERLEAIASDFNPFVAMGWTRQEARHSTFLRWILDPAESHGLGTYPLRVFLKYVVSRGVEAPDAPTLFDIDGWNLTRTTAITEWEQIDVFLQNDEDGFIVVVENKIDSTEHSDQLTRYADLVEKRFQVHRKCFVYLTPDGDQPSDERYVAGSYRDVAELLDLVCNRRGSQTSDHIVGFIRAYSEMVRRHIVEDSEVQELCRRIYANHRKALDMIYEHRPDRQQQLSDAVESLVRASGGMLDQCSKAYVRWTPPALSRFPAVGEGWTRSGQMLLFEIDSSGDGMVLKLILGPGPKELRERVHATVKECEIFNRRHYKFYPKWWTFHGLNLLSGKRFASIEIDEAEAHLREHLGKFFKDELPRIEEALLPIIENLEKGFVAAS